MSTWNKVVIVGVGLLGGSVGLGLRKRGLASEIVGVDRDPTALRRAENSRAIDSSESSLPRAIAGAELVVLCTPIDFIPKSALETLRDVNFAGVVTDVGSTKRSIIAELNQAIGSETESRFEDRPGKHSAPNMLSRFVGSHPLAGGERSGPEHADPDLFVDAVTILVPLPQTTAATKQTIASLWTSLGSRLETLESDTHDQIMAAVSHLPHLVASALSASTPQDALPFAANGWRDSTRIAAGDAALWASILLDNRDNLLASINRFDAQVTQLKTALQNRDRETLLQLLQTGKNHRDSLGS